MSLNHWSPERLQARATFIHVHEGTLSEGQREGESFLRSTLVLESPLVLHLIPALTPSASVNRGK